MADIEKMVLQLDELIRIAEQVLDVGWHEDFKARRQAQVISNRLEAAMDRIVLPGTVYAAELAELRTDLLEEKFDDVYSLAVALRDDLKAGWVESVVELVHADTHSNYLDMADELLGKDYKDAAAVITGTSLEVHVRALCLKYGVNTGLPNGSPKRADSMNADLKKAGVYDTLRQKQLTAWMDLRNKAAHGDYQAYSESDVRSFVQGVRDFMLRYPA